ncbi:MAG: glutathione S-transferase family protein [Arenicellales bacterium WSBS_2016_MAG_OTU3]
MILVGQLDSPFVRRVAVALNFYGIEFERTVLSVFANFEEILKINPLGKVPILELDDGDRIFDSRYILDYLEEIAGDVRKLVPTDKKAKRNVLTIDSVALGLAEKTYERGIEFTRKNPESQDQEWVARLTKQIHSALAWLEARDPAPLFLGEGVTRADITCACAFKFLSEKQPHLIGEEQYPKLKTHSAYCESLDVFSASSYSATEAAATGWKQREI